MKEENITVDFQGKEYSLCVKYANLSTEVILLIHGIGDSLENFDHIWACAEFSGYSIIAVDLLGFGKSSKPENFSYAIQDQAALCALVLESFYHDRVHIVAHSVGGAVGVLLGARLANRLGSIVSIEGNLIAEDCGLVTRNAVSIPYQQFKDQRFPARRERLKQSGRSTYGHDHADPWAFYKTAQSVVSWSDSGILISTFLSLPAPRAYFYGQENRHMPVLKQLPDTPLVEISDSGHCPMLDNPRDFYAELFQFISSSRQQLRSRPPRA